ncbi:MAG: beta-ketothiolase BktB [Gammaproteobacteria bacterium]|nr:beta-ketothiolase BktB [Gammaproteobacteria bacterium]MDD9850465.1 beta-ketothiolase BktB [Gammaproteobacteria bacterium]
MPQRSVVFLSATRTAIGSFGGALSGMPPTELAAAVVRESLGRSPLSAGDIGHCVFGNVAHSDRRDAYLARCAALDGGLDEATPALTVNRLCGSGLQAVVSAAQCILLGDADAAIAGGAENMSRLPHWVHDLRHGRRMGDAVLEDAMLAALHDPFDDCHMGVTAENVAAKWNISRAQQDQWALESHRRAAAAIASGYFREQILPLKVKPRNKKDKKKNTGEIVFDTDEHPRADASLDALSAMRPAFQPDGSVTAGNSSGINDAAAALVMMEAGAAEKRGLQPLARLVAYDHAGVAPRYMGIGPVPAVRKVMARAGLGVGDMSVIELNEAFAAQALAVMADLELPPAKTNPNGSGISLGHPIGATGAILAVKAIYELKRAKGRYALVTMCIGGGQGIAAIIENTA